MCSYDYDDETGYRELIECRECLDAHQKLYEVEIAIRRAVEILYSHGALDKARLDDSIGQVCDAVGVNLPGHLPFVRRQGSELFEFAAAINQ